MGISAMNETELSDALVALKVLMAQWEVMDRRGEASEEVLALRRLTERYMVAAMKVLIAHWEASARLEH